MGEIFKVEKVTVTLPYEVARFLRRTHRPSDPLTEGDLAAAVRDVIMEWVVEKRKGPRPEPESAPYQVSFNPEKETEPMDWVEYRLVEEDCRWLTPAQRYERFGHEGESMQVDRMLDDLFALMNEVDGRLRALEND